MQHAPAFANLFSSLRPDALNLLTSIPNRADREPGCWLFKRLYAPDRLKKATLIIQSSPLPFQRLRPVTNTTTLVFSAKAITIGLTYNVYLNDCKIYDCKVHLFVDNDDLGP
jgi:hypothetical protein